MAEFVCLKPKETEHKQGTLTGKVVFSWRYKLTILKLLYMYNDSEQINKWMADSWSQDSHS